MHDFCYILLPYLDAQILLGARPLELNTFKNTDVHLPFVKP